MITATKGFDSGMGHIVGRFRETPTPPVIPSEVEESLIIWLMPTVGEILERESTQPIDCPHRDDGRG
jgi:hypothetical protein